ncbi:MAG: hypothetical protein PHS86_05775 [Syntrophaceae bacterium]|nr:hypothetical protein [Syntrophaceae bacterium]
MKKLLVLSVSSLITLSLWAISMAQGTSSYATDFSNLKEKISAQIERIKTTREFTQDKISMAKTRVEEEIIRSEEQLTLQLESLKELKEQLKTQAIDLDVTLKKASQDFSTFSEGALRDIEDQISQTNSMIDKIKGLKTEICSDCSTTNAPPNSSSQTGVTQTIDFSQPVTEQTQPLSPPPSSGNNFTTVTASGGG